MLNPVPRGAPAAGASAPGDVAERGRSCARAAVAAGGDLEVAVGRREWGAAGVLEVPGGHVTAAATPETLLQGACSAPASPKHGGRGVRAPTLMFGCPRETLQAPRMAPRHPGLRFPAEAKLT